MSELAPPTPWPNSAPYTDFSLPTQDGIADKFRALRDRLKEGLWDEAYRSARDSLGFVEYAFSEYYLPAGLPLPRMAFRLRGFLWLWRTEDGDDAAVEVRLGCSQSMLGLSVRVVYGDGRPSGALSGEPDYALLREIEWARLSYDLRRVKVVEWNDAE